MGIGIRNNGSGNRVTIDGEKVVKKINFKRRNYLTDSNSTGSRSSLGASKIIAILNDTTFAHTHYYNNGYGFYELIIVEYDKNTGKTHDYTVRQDSDAYEIASGYKDNVYQIKGHYENSRYVHGVYEYKLNTGSSENKLIETELTNSSGINNIVQKDLNTLYWFNSNDSTICKFDKKSGKSTEILKTSAIDSSQNIFLFEHKTKLYLIAAENSEASKAQNIYEINLKNNEITKLFNICEKFNITPTNVASRLDRENGKIIFYFLESYALKQCEWDIEKNTFSEVKELFKSKDYAGLQGMAVEENEDFKMYLVVKQGYLEERIYSKVYTREVV